MTPALRPLLRPATSGFTARTFSTTQPPLLNFRLPRNFRSIKFPTHRLPRILQPQYWSFVALLRPTLPEFLAPGRPWNPYTFFVLIFLGIGSEAIQFIAMKKGHEETMRKGGARVDKLRELVEKVQNGKEVDVKKELLGVGGGEKEREEREWEEVMREIEKEDAQWAERGRVIKEEEEQQVLRELQSQEDAKKAEEAKAQKKKLKSLEALLRKKEAEEAAAKEAATEKDTKKETKWY